MAHLYAGFLGGMASAVALQPLDLLKTRLQQAPAHGFIATVRSLGSLKEAWRGTLPSVIRTSVGAGLYLSMLSQLRAYREHQVTRGGADMGVASGNGPPRSSALPRLAALDNVVTSASARALIGFVMMPITVVKVRFESDLFRYTSIVQATADIVRGPQGFRGLFAGYLATVSRDAPYAGIYMLFYEKLKDALQFEQVPGPVINSGAAMAAAALSTTVTAPFDTLKTRIQVSVEPVSFGQALREVVAKSWLSLFDGLSLRLTRKALSSGISWCIYEEIVKRTR